MELILLKELHTAGLEVVEPPGPTAVAEEEDIRAVVVAGYKHAVAVTHKLEEEEDHTQL